VHQTLSPTRERWLVSFRPSSCFGTCIQSCLGWHFWSNEGFRICQWQEVEACPSHQHCSTQPSWDAPCSIASFKLLCGQGIVRLLRCHVLVKVNRWFSSGHTVSCCTYLHSVKQSSFIHVVDVTPLILIQSQTNLRQALFNHNYVGWSRLPKAAVGLDATAIFECLQPPIWELKGPVARVEIQGST